MVVSSFPMVPCGSPIVLCCFPIVLCHGAAIRRSPAQLCGLPYGAVPRRCHQALASAALRASRWCSFRSGFFAAASAHSRQRSSASSVPQSQRCSSLFRDAVSGAAADMLLAKRTKMPILCSEGAKTREISPFLTQKCRFCAQNARKRGFRRQKAHKNPDFVLGKPENKGSKPQKRTKTPILWVLRQI